VPWNSRGLVILRIEDKLNEKDSEGPEVMEMDGERKNMKSFHPFDSRFYRVMLENGYSGIAIEP